MFTKRRLVSLTLLGLIFLACIAGCSSRYRLDLYLATQEMERKKVKVETTHYAPNTVLSPPEAQQQIVPGTRSTAVITTSTRGRQGAAEGGQVFGFDEYLRLRLYIEFPAPLIADTVDLGGRSYVHMLGRYELPAESKIFYPREGTLVIDSVTGDRLYASIRGIYINPDSATITYDGQFRIKIRD